MRGTPSYPKLKYKKWEGEDSLLVLMEVLMRLIDRCTVQPPRWLPNGAGFRWMSGHGGTDFSDGIMHEFPASANLAP